MPTTNINHDAVIVGGGFYGAAIAIYLAVAGAECNTVIELTQEHHIA